MSVQCDGRVEFEKVLKAQQSFEHFMFGVQPGLSNGQMVGPHLQIKFSGTGAAITTLDTSEDAVGFIGLNTGSAQTGYCSLHSIYKLIQYSSLSEFVCHQRLKVLNLINTTDEFKIKAGMSMIDMMVYNDLQFYYDKNSPNWRILYNLDGNEIINFDTGIVVTTDWVKLTIEKKKNDAKIYFRINDTPIYDMTPIFIYQSLGPSFGIYKTKGSAMKYLYADYAYYSFELV